MSEAKKMTYLEYQDGGRSSFAECCRTLLQALSKGNQRKKSSLIYFYCQFNIEECLKYKRYELFIEVILHASFSIVQIRGFNQYNSTL